MTGQQPEIQWYIAREGKQHGPLSDAEMRTFVAQGHLRPTDLIWRPGFPDWRPAPAVFPFKAPEPMPAAPPAPEPQPQHYETRAPSAGQLAPQGGEHTFDPNRIRVAPVSGNGKSSRLRPILGTALLVVLLAGGGIWFVSQDREAQQQEVADTTEADSGDVTQTGAIAPSLEPDVAVSSEEVQEKAKVLDAKFQRMELWTVVKSEFPDWYGERLGEVAKLSAQNQPESAINKHLAESLVALRRKYASSALAASTEQLKSVATAFLQNLKSLSELGPTACFGFISKGETAPGVLDLLQSPEQGAALQAQVAAIFKAIAQGRKTPTAHDPAGKADYEVLVQQLAKLGWKQEDLRVFSDPKALAQQPPNRVCQMVQDWFVAHLSVEDKSTQERLLVETLKPVVSG